VCAAIIDTQDLEKVREELRPLRLPGQVKLHWTDERNSRRRKIVDTLSGIDSMQAIITHQSEVSKKTERHRRKCLEQMYFELSEMHVYNVTLESRQEAQNRLDIANIVALQGQGQSAGIRLRHVRGDLVKRQFNPPVPTTGLCGDITYLRTSEGWMYLATVIDLSTRMVIGWQVADRMTTTLIIDALAMAHRAGFVAGNAIFHSDRGSQYTSARFAEYAASIDVRLSVGAVGVCWDNAVAESFFSTLKLHLMYKTKQFPTKLEARIRVGEWIETYYNRRRIHTATGQVPAQSMNRFLNPETPAAQAA